MPRETLPCELRNLIAPIFANAEAKVKETTSTQSKRVVRDPVLSGG